MFPPHAPFEAGQAVSPWVLFSALFSLLGKLRLFVAPLGAQRLLRAPQLQKVGFCRETKKKSSCIPPREGAGMGRAVLAQQLVLCHGDSEGLAAVLWLHVR